MSINRIDRQSFINAYSVNSNRCIEKVNKVQNVDKIEISSLGKSLKKYDASQEIDNSKKIEEIKNKINNGTYNIDAKLTAESILKSIKESK